LIFRSLLSILLIFGQGTVTTGPSKIIGPSSITQGSGSSAPTFVQEADNATAAAVATLTVTFSSNVTAGNSIICMSGWSGSATFTSLQDGTAANFTAIDSKNPSGTTITSWLPSTSGGASASSITITISAQSSGSDLTIMCQEWHGATTLDVHAIASQSFPGTGANAFTSGSVTTTGTSGDGCAGFEMDNGGTTDNFTAGTLVAWVLRANPGRVFMASESFSQSASGSIAATFTSANGGAIVSQTAIVCIK
jgi:hypothetical protein